MRIETATEEHLATIAGWWKLDRLEEQTCRPVIDGHRVPPDGKSTRLVFFTTGVDEPAGTVTVFDVNPRNRSAELGYRVNPSCRGRGVGQQMLRAALDHLFSTTDFNKLHCQTASFNQPSVRLLERLGFHRDGVLREHHELDGMLWDDYIYSILRSEWEIGS